jgi:hypothetical protein
MHPTRIFKSADELQKAFNEYKESLKEEAKQWLKIQYVGKDGERVADPQKVPYTLEGFKRYCRQHYGEVQHYFDNTDNYYNDFCVICRAIKEEIRENQITGGLLGFYNPSITQRLNNLTDKVETTIVEQPLFPETEE